MYVHTSSSTLHSLRLLFKNVRNNLSMNRAVANHLDSVEVLLLRVRYIHNMYVEVVLFTQKKRSRILDKKKQKNLNDKPNNINNDNG